jgi:ATP-dependent DNA ligase
MAPLIAILESVARTTLPTVALMQPTLVSRPFHREGLVYEEKVDGYRMVVHKDGAAVKLVSRQGIDHTRRYPDIVAAIRALEVPTLILDGEIAIFDQKLISRLEWLRRRAPAEVATPPLFMAFDCLYCRGQDLRPRPLATRRNVLEDVLDGQDLVLPVRRPHSTHGICPAGGSRPADDPGRRRLPDPDRPPSATAPSRVLDPLSVPGLWPA